MAKSLKTKGLDELRAFKARTLRQRALGRINQGDCDAIIHKVNEVEALVIKIREKGNEAERWG